MRSAKFRFFTTRPGDSKWCGLCKLGWEQPNLQFWAEYEDIRFCSAWGHQKSAFSKVVPEIWNASFCVTYVESSLTCKFELSRAILDFDRLEVSRNPIFHNSSRRHQMERFLLVSWEHPNLQIWAQSGDFRFWPIWGHQKSEIFTTRPANLKWCVLCELRWLTCYLQIWGQYGDFRFWPIWGEKKSDFSLLVPETSNCAFCISYPEGSLTCIFELNAGILDFGRVEDIRNSIFHNSSRRPQMVRFVLVTLKEALPANLSSIGGF